jgi:hypothetical protein
MQLHQLPFVGYDRALQAALVQTAVHRSVVRSSLRLSGLLQRIGDFRFRSKTRLASTLHPIGDLGNLADCQGIFREIWFCSICSFSFFVKRLVLDKRLTFLCTCQMIKKTNYSSLNTKKQFSYNNDLLTKTRVLETKTQKFIT